MRTEITPILRHYGAVDPPESGQWQPIRCCFHDDNHASARINPDDGAFACLACGMKGDALALIMRKERCEFVVALRKYEEITGAPPQDVQGPTQGQRWRPLSGKQRDYDSDGGLFSTGVRWRPSAGR